MELKKEEMGEVVEEQMYFVQSPSAASTSSHPKTTSLFSNYYSSPSCINISTKTAAASKYFIFDGDGDGDGGDDDDLEGKGGVWRFLSLDPSSSSWCCIGFQVLWRFLASLGVALLVFYLSTKPPLPNISFQVSALDSFVLSEGVDATNVATKVLSFNCSMKMKIENHSKVFGLHLHPTNIQATFGTFLLAKSQVEATYIRADDFLVLPLFVGTQERAVYGAGRAMQDLLESNRSLSLIIRARFTSTYRVVGNLIQTRYRHSLKCILTLDETVQSERRQISPIDLNSVTCSVKAHKV